MNANTTIHEVASHGPELIQTAIDEVHEALELGVATRVATMSPEAMARAAIEHLAAWLRGDEADDRIDCHNLAMASSLCLVALERVRRESEPVELALSERSFAACV